MDDGFQNPAVAKDASIIVIDSQRGLGNGKVFPAGPLRAPLPPQIARTDALVVVGDGAAAKMLATEIAVRGKPVLAARLKPDDASLTWLQGRRVLAFAGIGDPARFFHTLRKSGVDVIGESAFPDHHVFSKADIDGLLSEATRHGLTLVTTEKDLARLKLGGELPVWAQAVVPFAVTLEFDDGAALRKFVGDSLFKARENRFRT
jgi:tetraacyldisaccharide 4'-kinase